MSDHTRIHPWSRRVNLFMILFLAVTMMFGGAVAQASTLSTPTSSRVTAPIDKDTGSNPDASPCSSVGRARAEESAKSELLPINRWAGATSDMHTRIDSGLIERVQTSVQRNFVDNQLMGFGDQIWRLSVSIGESSSRFCIADGISLSVDQIVGKVGKPLIDSNVLALLAVFAFVSLLWRARTTGSFNIQGFVRIGLCVGLAAGMVFGAANTTVDPKTGTGSFGKASPGWWATKINTIVTSMATQPLDTLSKSAISLSNDHKVTAAGFTPNPLDCSFYMDELRKRYRASYGDKQGSMSSVPMMLDSMWQQSGLKVYKDVQFGLDNPYGQRVFCRQLDYSAGTDPANAVDVTAASWPSIKAGDWAQKAPVSNAFAPKDNDTVDRGLIGWAACSADTAKGDGFVLTPGFDKLNLDYGGVLGSGIGAKEKSMDPKDCWTWMGSPAAGESREDLSKTALEWNQDTAEIAKRTRADQVNPEATAVALNEFINYYHGITNRTSSSMLVIYVIAAFVSLLVFGGIGIAINCAKVAMYVVLLMALFQVMASLVRESDKPFEFLKTFAGVSFYVVLLQALQSIVAIIATALNGFASDLNPVGIIMWSAITPLIALVGILLIAKKVLKAPNLLKPSAAFAFAGAGGSMLGGFMDRAAKKTEHTTRRVGAAAANKATGGRIGGNWKQKKGENAAVPSAVKKKPITAQDAAARMFGGAGVTKGEAMRTAGVAAATAAGLPGAHSLHAMNGLADMGSELKNQTKSDPQEVSATAAEDKTLRKGDQAKQTAGYVGAAMSSGVARGRSEVKSNLVNSAPAQIVSQMRANSMARGIERQQNGLFNEQADTIGKRFAARVGNTGWQGARALGNRTVDLMAHPLQHGKALKYATLGTAAALLMPMPVAAAGLAAGAGIWGAKKLGAMRPTSDKYTAADAQKLQAWREQTAETKETKALTEWEKKVREEGYKVNANGEIVDGLGKVQGPDSEIYKKLGPRPGTPILDSQRRSQSALLDRQGWTKNDDGNIVDANGNQVDHATVAKVLGATGQSSGYDGSLTAGDHPNAGFAPEELEQMRQLMAQGTTDPDQLAEAMSIGVRKAQAMQNHLASSESKPEEKVNPVTGELESVDDVQPVSTPEDGKDSAPALPGGRTDAAVDDRENARRPLSAEDFAALPEVSMDTMLPGMEALDPTPEPVLPGLDMPAPKVPELVGVGASAVTPTRPAVNPVTPNRPTARPAANPAFAPMPNGGIVTGKSASLASSLMGRRVLPGRLSSELVTGQQGLLDEKTSPIAPKKEK